MPAWGGILAGWRESAFLVFACEPSMDRAARGSKTAGAVRAHAVGADAAAPVEAAAVGHQVEPVLRRAFGALGDAGGEAGGGHVVAALARVVLVPEQAQRDRVGLVAAAHHEIILEAARGELAGQRQRLRAAA